MTKRSSNRAPAPAAPADVVHAAKAAAAEQPKAPPAPKRDPRGEGVLPYDPRNPWHDGKALAPPPEGEEPTMTVQHAVGPNPDGLTHQQRLAHALDDDARGAVARDAAKTDRRA